MHILLVNDDGIYAQGLRELAGALAREHKVTVCAPSEERSAIGHSITLRAPLFVKKVEFPQEIEAYAISGTPVDCTRLGLQALTREPIDLVISGVNHGENVAMDVLYSGTVSAALEGAMLGYKSIAVSAASGADMKEAVAAFMELFPRISLEKDIRHVLNVNIPKKPAAEITQAVWVSQDVLLRTEGYEKRESPDGRPYFWLRSEGRSIAQEKSSDLTALHQGCITLTPLTFYATDREGFGEKNFELA